MKKIEFKVKLEGMEGSEVAAVVAAFDVQGVFGTRVRVPVRGTINRFAYRSSLMPMGGCHCMVANRQMREGAGGKAVDTVKVQEVRPNSGSEQRPDSSSKKAAACAAARLNS